jgi:hypothetical protein
MNNEQREIIDTMLWDIANGCMREVYASDEYKKESAEHNARRVNLETTLTEEQRDLLSNIEESLIHQGVIENRLVRREIYFFGLVQGVEIGRQFNENQH